MSRWNINSQGKSARLQLHLYNNATVTHRTVATACRLRFLRESSLRIRSFLAHAHSLSLENILAVFFIFDRE